MRIKLVPTAHQEVRSISILQTNCLHKVASFSKVRHYSFSFEARHSSSLSNSIFHEMKLQMPAVSGIIHSSMP